MDWNRQKEDSRGRRQGPPVLCTLRNDGIARWHPAHALRARAIRTCHGATVRRRFKPAETFDANRVWRHRLAAKVSAGLSAG